MKEPQAVLALGRLTIKQVDAALQALQPSLWWPCMRSHAISLPTYNADFGVAKSPAFRAALTDVEQAVCELLPGFAVYERAFVQGQTTETGVIHNVRPLDQAGRHVRVTLSGACVIAGASLEVGVLNLVSNVEQLPMTIDKLTQLVFTCLPETLTANEYWGLW